jgi:hypothetical protein
VDTTSPASITTSTSPTSSTPTFFGYIGVGVTAPGVVVKNAAAGLLEGVAESVQAAAEESKKK